MKIIKSMSDYLEWLTEMDDGMLLLQCKSKKWLSGIKGEFQSIYEAERAACKAESDRRGAGIYERA